MTFEASAFEQHDTEDSLSRRLTSRRRHAELVDEIERGLSVALQEYRFHAEEVLARHMSDLEQAEAAHDLEMSKLRAENARLRDALGAKGQQEATLFQTVMFQQMEEPIKEQPTNKRLSTWEKKKQAGSLMSNQKDQDGDDKILNSRKAAALKQSQAQAGSWQHFVAWVPNAAALMAPQPWKPLPQEALTPPNHWHNSGHNSGHNNLGRPLGAGLHKAPSELPMLPGMVNEEDKVEVRKAKPKNTEDDVSTDSDNDEEKEPYEVSEAWKATDRQLERLRKRDQNSEYVSRGSGTSEFDMVSSNAGPSEDDDEDYDVPTANHWFIIHPHSKKRVAWDIGSLIMVVYDMIMIPMSAFDLGDHAFLTAMDWCTRLFWTFDIYWSMTTAVVLSDGKINFRLKFIVKRYLRTWFPLDLLIVSSDWLEVALSSINVFGLGRLARAFRIARVVRLLRLVRMQEIMQAITERVQSDRLAFVISVLKTLIFVLVSSHVLACLWWAVGKAHDGTATWIEQKGYAEAELGYKYLVSLHWAMTQFTGGMDEIVAINTLERFYVILSWSYAFMAGAVICSILTSNLTHLHIIGGAQARQMSTLRKYLKQNHINSNLALRVQRSAQHAVTGDLAAEDVTMLSIVAEPLRVELNFEIYSIIMRNHPFFSDYFHDDPQVMRRICHVGMSMRLLDKGDVVFSKGEVPREPKMYFIVKGLLEYYSRSDVLAVGERQWISEACLWTNWKHRGTFTATTEVKMAVLDVQTFKDIVQRFKSKNSFDPRLYAHEFVENLNNQARVDDLTFLT